MRPIYDNNENVEKLDGVIRQPKSGDPDVVSTSYLHTGPIAVAVGNDEQKAENTTVMQINNELAEYQQQSMNALKIVDDIVLKRYLAKLSEMDIVPVAENELPNNDIILFKINKMVYEKDEYATDKFISVVSAMTFTNSSIYLIVDGHKDRTDFFMGIKCEDEYREKSSVAETFRNSLLGQFPGAILEDYSYINAGANKSRQDALLHRMTDAVSVSSCVGIPSYKNSKGEYTNANFIQGIEKFACAMQGKEYTAVILASNVTHPEIANIRNGYENIYTELSAMATKQLAYSTNESLANAFTRTKGYTDTTGESDTIGTSVSKGTSTAHTEGTSTTKTTTKGSSKENGWSKAANFADAIAQVGTILAFQKMEIGLPMMIGGLVVSSALKVGSKQLSESTSNAESANSSDSNTQSETNTDTESHTRNSSHAENFSEADGTTSTIGTSKNFTITIQDKHIVEIQKRIDKQLERIELCESTGLWSTGAYFMSYDTDRAAAEIGATIFRSIMQGEHSGIETSAINTWYPESEKEYKSLLAYISTLSHPVFVYSNPAINTGMSVLPTSLLSSKELAIMLGLPRKSVPGLPVTEHVSMAKDVVRLHPRQKCDHLQLGCIFDQGVERQLNKVYLDTNSLTQHTFVTGSTGCGKSNTIYYLIKQIRNQPNAPKFLVIEPAKGEYKDVFGNENIYGTNPLKTPLLRINPFKFPDGVHVLEHIDRLVEIFNVCWPMYAAMPAVLKEAILNSYEDCGWDLYNSTNKYSSNLFPTFADLQNELILVINNSAYSEEVKSNYQGSLVTRVKSLNNGICKHIFLGNELGDAALFDENVIVDLSRIGSQETKSLIMGILIMRLNEYRANSDISHNSVLRHVTILEEAHNILKRCSQEQNAESSNVAGKSVEMISNAIAEMRTYGEGFIIVDQSPGAVDVSAIRNTNTKIIMRLPEESDRKVAGKASGMKDNQIDEIAKLPTGVAVVYQNDWEDPVLCKIGKFDEKESSFEFRRDDNSLPHENINAEVLKLLMKGRTSCAIDVNIELIENGLHNSELSTYNKTFIYEAIDEYRKTGELHLWKDSYFETLSRLVTEIVSAKYEVERLAAVSSDFDILTIKLKELVENKIPNIPRELVLIISQCLMRDYSLGNDVRMRIYGAWIQTVKSHSSNE